MPEAFIVDAVRTPVGKRGGALAAVHSADLAAHSINALVSRTGVDPGAVDEPAKVGSLSIRIGLGWAKSHSFTTGQCPVMKYNRQLMMAILHDKVQIAKNVNATVIPLDQAPQGYQEFDKGAAKKYILDPHGMVGSAA